MSVFLVYFYDVEAQKQEDFEQWAKEKGSTFWSSVPGVKQVTLFRQANLYIPITIAERRNYYGGGCVEFSSLEILEAVLRGIGQNPVANEFADFTTGLSFLVFTEFTPVLATHESLMDIPGELV